MALNIKHPEADRLARELAEQTGESITEAVIRSLQERLLRLRGRARSKSLEQDLAAIRKRSAKLKVVDARLPDEIVGYDEHGIPR